MSVNAQAVVSVAFVSATYVYVCTSWMPIFVKKKINLLYFHDMSVRCFLP